MTLADDLRQLADLLDANPVLGVGLRLHHDDVAEAITLIEPTSPGPGVWTRRVTL